MRFPCTIKLTVDAADVMDALGIREVEHVADTFRGAVMVNGEFIDGPMLHRLMADYLNDSGMVPGVTFGPRDVKFEIRRRITYDGFNHRKTEFYFNEVIVRKRVEVARDCTSRRPLG